jgi:hypothetical protein
VITSGSYTDSAPVAGLRIVACTKAPRLAALAMVQPDASGDMPFCPVSCHGVARPAAVSGLAGTMMSQLVFAAAAAGADVLGVGQGDVVAAGVVALADADAVAAGVVGVAAGVEVVGVAAGLLAAGSVAAGEVAAGSVAAGEVAAGSVAAGVLAVAAGVLAAVDGDAAVPAGALVAAAGALAVSVGAAVGAALLVPGVAEVDVEGDADAQTAA